MNNGSSMDQAFLKKLTEVVEKNLGNEQFGVEDLAREAGMSRSQIHRKLHDLTGKSTTQFIREIRLEHAMEMLRNEIATVSEIAYQVGFSSPTYFSTCFHKHYGYPPGEASERNPKKRQDESPKEKTEASSQSQPKSKLPLYTIVAFIIVLLLGGYYYISQNSGTAQEERQSIAVLPLDNLTGDPDQSYYVEGLHDALIGELGRLSQLRVISRTSTLQFRDTQSDIREIAKQLDVNNIIEGSVYKAGDSVRVQAQLIEVNPKEQHIWAQSYERGTQDILSMLSEITREIAHTVNVTLSPVEDSLLADRREVNPEAYKAYLRGRYELTKYTEKGYKKGISYLLQATRIDPADPLPWARLALGYNTAGHGSAPPPDAFDKARAAAERALKLDETLGEVHLALALVDLYQEWDWKAAKQGFDQVLKYNPNIAEAHAHYSWFKILLGASMGEAIAEQKLAMKLDPFIPLYPTYLGHLYWTIGEYDKAIDVLEEALILDPEFAYAHYVLGGVYTDMGRFGEAIRANKKASELSPNWRFGLANTYALAGQNDKARTIAEELAADPKPIETWGLAELHANLDEIDKAFQWLDASYEVRFSWYPWIYWNPYFNPLKSDRRFKSHLDQIDLPVDLPLATASR